MTQVPSPLRPPRDRLGGPAILSSSRPIFFTYKAIVAALRHDDGAAPSRSTVQYCVQRRLQRPSRWKVDDWYRLWMGL